jgi:hypothetical protein
VVCFKKIELVGEGREKEERMVRRGKGRGRICKEMRKKKLG